MTCNNQPLRPMRCDSQSKQQHDTFVRVASEEQTAPHPCHVIMSPPRTCTSARQPVTFVLNLNHYKVNNAAKAVL